MEKENSNKIRLLLNELAILNQPEVHDGKFIYHLDTLQRLKQLSSELYLLSDTGLFGTGQLEIPQALDLNLEHKTAVEATEVNLNIELVEEKLPESIAEQNEPFVEPEIVEEVAPPAIETIQEAPKEIPVMNQIQTPSDNLSKNPVSAISNGSELASKISLSRRFEYINNLFASDTEAFNDFLSQIAAAGSVEKSMDKFDEIYTSKNWRRKSETASDLKQLLRKLL